jgi:hypothetical protein
MATVTGEAKTAAPVAAYEPPALRVVGSLHGLTQSSDFPCVWKKTIGPPDYFTFIPIANCS